jgi:hypothetical protein
VHLCFGLMELEFFICSGAWTLSKGLFKLSECDYSDFGVGVVLLYVGMKL